MTLLPGIPRLKLVVAEYGPVLVVVLAVAGILALGSAGWTYANPPTTTVTDQVDKQTIQSELGTGAVVTGDSNLYERGTRLTNRPIYFVDTAPNLSLTVRTTAPADQPVRIDHTIELVVRASADGNEFWSRSRVLANERETTSDGTASTSTTVDVPALEERLAPVRAEVGAAGSIEVLVRVTTAYETNQYAGELHRTTPLKLSGGTYAVEQVTLETTESSSASREIVLPTWDESAFAFPAGIGAVALLVAGAIAATSRRRDRWNVLEDDVHRQRYEEWISMGSLPRDLGTEHVPIASLEDLADVAIDTGKRVVYDDERERYAVIDGPVVYYYGDADEWDDRDDDADDAWRWRGGDDRRDTGGES